MAKKVLIVTKDRMEFNIYHPVVCNLQKRGFEPVIVAEGLSMEMWVKAGQEIWSGLPKAGDFDPDTRARTDIDPYAVLTEVKPDLVMTGLANPLRLGGSFGEIANRLKVRLGYVEDLWGVHSRSPAFPDFVCTVDELGAKMIREYAAYSQASLGDVYDYLTTDRTPKIYVTGCPADDVLLAVKPDPKTEEILEACDANMNNSRVILACGQDESTTPMLQGVVEVVMRDPYSLLIPRLHPKWMSDPSKAEFKKLWLETLKPAEERGKVYWADASVDTRSLIRSATEVVSIYSNVLREAALLNRMPVSWTSDIARTRMLANNGFSQYPLVSIGATLEVSSTEEYLARVHRTCTKGHLDILNKLRETVQEDGRATERVVQAMLAESNS